MLEIDSGNYLKAWNNRSIHKNIDSLLIPKDKLEAYKIQASYETLSKSALFGWKMTKYEQKWFFSNLACPQNPEIHIFQEKKKRLRHVPQTENSF